jgi:hypothetical protein
MNIHKHMEAILLAALGTLYAIGLTLDSLPEAKASPRPAMARNIATGATMAVVVVRAPKLPRQP